MNTKKRFIFLSCLVLVFSLLFSVAVQAEAPQSVLVSQYTEYYADGSSCVISVYQDVPSTRARGTTSGSKNCDHRDENGIVVWTLTVYGSYSYNGVSATCTSASYGYTIHNSAWSRVSGSAARSGNTATAYGTFAKDGQNHSASVSLSCDANGNLS